MTAAADRPSLARASAPAAVASLAQAARGSTVDGAAGTSGAPAAERCDGVAAGALVLDRYDARSLARLFDEEGVTAVIAKRGFHRPWVAVEENGTAPPCLRLRAEKSGRTHLLFEVRLTRITLDPAAFPAPGPRPNRPVSLLEIFWARQQDPTGRFSAMRPRLPAQDHPGLGILRNVFRAGERMCAELGYDGIGNLPKLPHDAAIFQATLGFAFLDPCEQGRFEALVRDLSHLGLRDFSLALVGGAVHERDGRVAAWRPGVQAVARDAVLTEYLRCQAYDRARTDAARAAHYTVDPVVLGLAASTFEASAPA